MSDEIIKVFDALGEKLGIAIDWGQENIYPYIQDLCQRATQYKITNNIIVLSVWAIIFAFSIFGIIFIIKKFPKGVGFDYLNDWVLGLSIFGLIIFSVLIMLSLAISIQSVDNICMYTYVPERALIDMLHSI